MGTKPDRLEPTRSTTLFGLTETTGDNAKRFEYFQECEAILARESPIMPIYFYERNNLVRTEVKGWYENLLNIHPLTRSTWSRRIDACGTLPG